MIDATKTVVSNPIQHTRHIDSQKIGKVSRKKVLYDASLCAVVSRTKLNVVKEYCMVQNK